MRQTLALLLVTAPLLIGPVFAASSSSFQNWDCTIVDNHIVVSFAQGDGILCQSYMDQISSEQTKTAQALRTVTENIKRGRDLPYRKGIETNLRDRLTALADLQYYITTTISTFEKTLYTKLHLYSTYTLAARNTTVQQQMQRAPAFSDEFNHVYDQYLAIQQIFDAPDLSTLISARKDYAAMMQKA